MMHQVARTSTLLAGLTVVLAASGDTSRVATDPNHVAPAAKTSFDQTLKETNNAQIVSATGDIRDAVTEYRNLLGGGPNPNPNVPGDLGSGRREINWDGV